MNAPDQIAKLRRRGPRLVVTLPAGFELEGRAGVYRTNGREIVLEPDGGAQAIPPGTYTPDTLPPLSEGARAILASIDAVAPFVDVPAAAKAGDEARGIALEDEGLEGIDLSDEGLPGLDPDL